MGKRTTGTYPRRESDFYPTPPETTAKVIPHLDNRVKIIAEPMCGDGAIVEVFVEAGYFTSYVADITPRGHALNYDHIQTKDVFETTAEDFDDVDVIVSNPPWPSPKHHNPSDRAPVGAGQPTVAIIKHLIQFKPCWMLLSADFMHNQYFGALAPYCRKIVSVGRVKWIPDSKAVGMDNACWYFFETTIEEWAITEFIGNFKPAEKELIND